MTEFECELLRRITAIEAKVSDEPKAEPPTVDWYKRVLDTLSTIVLVSGLLFTVLQVGKWQESNDLTMWNTASNEWTKLDLFFVQHSELKKYFYDGVAAQASEPTYDKVQMTAVYVLNMVDYLVSTSDYLMTKHPDAKSIIQPELWEAYFRRTYFQSPAVCDRLRSLADGYSTATRRIGASACPKS